MHSILPEMPECAEEGGGREEGKNRSSTNYKIIYGYYDRFSSKNEKSAQKKRILWLLV